MPVDLLPSPDPDFLEGCNATARVERDANRAGGVTSPMGGVSPDYRPVAGLGSVPLVLIEGRADTLENGDGPPTPVMRWTALFGAPIALDLNDRLVVNLADRPTTPRYLCVLGASVAAFQMSHHWSCELAERVPQKP